MGLTWAGLRVGAGDMSGGGVDTGGPRSLTSELHPRRLPFCLVASCRGICEGFESLSFGQLAFAGDACIAKLCVLRGLLLCNASLCVCVCLCACVCVSECVRVCV